MLSIFRQRFGIPGVISVVALVFAMTGGAFAAKYLITSTKQIKPSVLKKLEGEQGPAGATGPQGLAGPAGANGATGSQGPEGSPWTAGGTLPSGATETGNFAFVLPSPDSEFSLLAPISFDIPLATPLGEAQVHYSTQVGFSTTCTGLVASPTAPSGHLCVYRAAGENDTFSAFLKNEASALSHGANIGGTVLSFGRASLVEGMFVRGTWAVTG